MSCIEPGTLCYLVRSGDPAFLGRVVEVLTPARPQPDGVLYHTVDAGWLRDIYGEREVIALPSQLRPIAGPPGGREGLSADSDALPGSNQTFSVSSGNSRVRTP